ncbi:MAG: S-layer homology domain-containing protein [Bacillota bacterium]|nr:S-layer homology domain-containing protein [Bacillota bacterium]
MRSNNGRAIKIFTGTVLTAALIFGSWGAVFAAAEFSDLDGTDCREAVEFLAEKNVLNGYGDGTFRPDGSITRAEICTAISKGMDPGEIKYSAAKKNSFTDVGTEYGWAEKYINYAAAMGAVDGYPDGTFRPAGNITYDELSAMVLKAMGYKASELSGTWPENFREKAKALKLYDDIFASLSAKETEDFDYGSQASRGDSAMMIKCAFDSLWERGKEEVPDSSAAGDRPVYDDGDYEWISGEGIELSLGDAVKIMKTEGYLAEMAELNRLSDEAIAKGYSDNSKSLKKGLQTLKDLESKKKMISGALNTEGLPDEQKAELEKNLEDVINAIDTMEKSGVNKANLDMANLQKEFAEDNIDANYEAEMNAIEYQTITLYYGILQAEENLRVCEENLELQKKLLRDTEIKYSAGAATSIEVKAQQMSVNSAEQDVKTAKSSAEKAKMSFNMLLGFEVTDNVILTDTLAPRGWQDINLEAAIDSALKNRLSIVQLRYACEIQELSLKSIGLSSTVSSGAYQKQKEALKITELALENMPKNIEIEMRSAYIDLKSKYNTIAESRETVNMAEESLRAAEVMFKAGMNTAADVQKAQVSVKQANQLLMASVADYNMALYDFEYASGVGRERIEL